MLILKKIVWIVCIFFNIHYHANASEYIDKSAEKNLTLISLIDYKEKALIFKDNYMIIQFWASWCHSCRGLFNDLASMLKSNSKIEYFAISLDKTPEIASSYAKNISNYELLKDNLYYDREKRLATFLNAKVVPTVLLIRNGEVISKISGHMNNNDLLKIKTAIQ